MAACCKIEVGDTSPGRKEHQHSFWDYHILLGRDCNKWNINRHINFTGLIWESIPLLSKYVSISYCTIKILHCCYASAFCRTTVHSNCHLNAFFSFVIKLNILLVSTHAAILACLVAILAWGVTPGSLIWAQIEHLALMPGLDVFPRVGTEHKQGMLLL